MLDFLASRVYCSCMTYTENCPSCSVECAMRVSGDKAWAECPCGEYFEVELWEDGKIKGHRS